MVSHEEFLEWVVLFKRIHARFERRKIFKYEFELYIRFQEESYPIWGLYQQAVVGNINVPKFEYMDVAETSWMWSWIHGNKKWHAWNNCKGLSKTEAMQMYIERVRDLQDRLDELVNEWKDEQDPRIPDTKNIEEDILEEVEKVAKEAKEARRSRDAERQREEEALGWWNEE